MPGLLIMGDYHDLWIISKRQDIQYDLIINRGRLYMHKHPRFYDWEKPYNQHKLS